ncbi:uncharacterized protein LOC123528267 [Mercenaria mercenaria]|uniref:uncharacterized protein LOC123528267 n=1 Tax=Mercenaria mercenaria TaxID=6596 RepID=UPI00234F8EF3|nr:uncharacterized protein LOC123528267 [Mercenaria mercenaria]
MATGGYDGSDELHYFTCNLCFKDGKNIPSVKFCVDCNQLMCQTCLNHHNKFDMMKDHQIQDNPASRGQRMKDGRSIPSLRCENHGGKILDMYCKTHDEPCCVVCISLDHSACARDYLPVAANGVIENFENCTVRNSSSYVINRLEKTQKAKLSNVEKIKGQKTRILQIIEKRRRTVDLQLNAMEAKAKNDLDNKSAVYSSSLKADAKQLEDIRILLEEESGMLDRAVENDQESDAFILMKRLNRHKNEAIILESRLYNKDKNLIIVENGKMQNMFEKLTLFGQISGCEEITHLHDENDYCVRAPNDADVCYISGCCILKDGSIILADQNNRKAKRLDSNFTLKDWLDLPGNPGAVCKVCTDQGLEEVAISVLSMNTIQFISTGKPMLLTRYFQVNNPCKGIAFMKGCCLLFLACLGQIQINALTGFSPHRQSLEHVSVPNHLIYNKSTNKVYIADLSLGVSVMEMGEFKVKTIFKDKNLLSPISVCCNRKHEMFVCGFDSHNIMQITVDGTFVSELLTQKQGLKNPCCLCLTRDESKMIISCKDLDYIKVVDFVRK